MPLYTFYCNSCAKEVKLFLSMKELRKTKICPTCSGSNLNGPLQNGTTAVDNQSQASCSLSKRS
ncbi:hypothetical protein KKI24_30020 [bacterium]|nr:hypothetical protein [bacterium]